MAVPGYQPPPRLRWADSPGDDRPGCSRGCLAGCLIPLGVVMAFFGFFGAALSGVTDDSPF